RATSGVRVRRLARARNFDVVQLGPIPDLARELAQRVELGLDRLPETAAVLGLVLLEAVHVGAQRVAPGRELDDLGFESLPLALGDSTRRRLGIGDEAARLLL